MNAVKVSDTVKKKNMKTSQMNNEILFKNNEFDSRYNFITWKTKIFSRKGENSKA